MGFIHSFRTCFSKSFSFSGRASRSEYWWFLPVGLLLPLLAWWALWLFAPDITASVRFALGLLFLAPLASVTARRLNDAGVGSQDIGPPMAALLTFAVLLVGLSWFSGVLESWIQGSGSPGGFLIMLAVSVPLLLLVAVTALCFLFGLFAGTSLFGQMILPSQPSEQERGPNAHEVVQ